MYNTSRLIRSRVDWTNSAGPQLESCDLAYSFSETPFGRDIVREVVEAGRKNGLKSVSIFFIRIGMTPIFGVMSDTRRRCRRHRSTFLQLTSSRQGMNMMTMD
jgi:hypothetical protein